MWILGSAGARKKGEKDKGLLDLSRAAGSGDSAGAK